MAPKPKQEFSEFIREVRLGKRKYLLVEGPTDRSFYTQWLINHSPEVARQPVITSVDSIDIDTGLLFAIGLNDGARSRVMYAALFADEESVPLLCIADRDCGHGVAKHSTNSLAWTDFPALESYAATPKVLDTLNRVFLSEGLGSGANALTRIAPILIDLFTVRLQNEHLPRPNIEKAWVRVSGNWQFEVDRAVSPSIAAQIPSYVRPTWSDLREVAYGHDVGSALLAVFSNLIRNGAKIPDLESLENALRASLLMTGGFESMPLFQKILKWVDA